MLYEPHEQEGVYVAARQHDGCRAVAAAPTCQQRGEPDSTSWFHNPLATFQQEQDSLAYVLFVDGNDAVYELASMGEGQLGDAAHRNAVGHRVDGVEGNWRAKL